MKVVVVVLTFGFWGGFFVIVGFLGRWLLFLVLLFAFLFCFVLLCFWLGLFFWYCIVPFKKSLPVLSSQSHSPQLSSRNVIISPSTFRVRSPFTRLEWNWFLSGVWFLGFSFFLMWTAICPSLLMKRPPFPHWIILIIPLPPPFFFLDVICCITILLGVSLEMTTCNLDYLRTLKHLHSYLLSFQLTYYYRFILWILEVHADIITWRTDSLNIKF